MLLKAFVSFEVAEGLKSSRDSRIDPSEKLTLVSNDGVVGNLGSRRLKNHNASVRRIGDADNDGSGSACSQSGDGEKAHVLPVTTEFLQARLMPSALQEDEISERARRRKRRGRLTTLQASGSQYRACGTAIRKGRDRCGT